MREGGMIIRRKKFNLAINAAYKSGYLAGVEKDLTRFGDGVQDATEVIRATIDSEGWVVFPPGTYLINSDTKQKCEREE